MNDCCTRYAPMNLDPGDTITFHLYEYAHDVVSVPTAAALRACDFEEKKQLCSSDGANIVDGTVSKGDGGKLAYVWAPTENGVYYISCTVGQHCVRGQRLMVTVGGPNPAGYNRTGHSNQPPPTADDAEEEHDDDDHDYDIEETSFTGVVAMGLGLAGLTW